MTRTSYDPNIEEPPPTMPDMLPMTPLERACVRLAACGLIPDDQARNCVWRWSTTTPQVPGFARSLPVFEAATTCDALKPFARAATSADGCGADCIGAGGTCDGGVCSARFNEPEPCGVCRSGTEYISCSFDGQQRYAVDCAAFGMICGACPVGDPNCFPAGARPAGECMTDAPTCDGDLSRQCSKTELQRLSIARDLPFVQRMTIPERVDLLARSKRATLDKLLPLLSRDALKGCIRPHRQPGGRPQEAAPRLAGHGAAGESRQRTEPGRRDRSPRQGQDTPESGLGLTNLHASRGDRTGPQAIPNRLIWTNDNLVPDCR